MAWLGFFFVFLPIQCVNYFKNLPELTPEEVQQREEDKARREAERDARIADMVQQSREKQLQECIKLLEYYESGLITDRQKKKLQKCLRGGY